MPDRTQHVLDAIDGALEDWSVSGDAMRWTPEPAAVNAEQAADIRADILAAWIDMVYAATDCANGATMQIALTGHAYLYVNRPQRACGVLTNVTS